MKQDPLIRLRTANPVPLAPAVDGNDLFERIVAEPGDSRLAARTRPTTFRRPAIVLALVFVIAAALVSTAVGVSSGWFESPPVKPPVTRHEYEVAQHQLTLPPGYTWPKLHIPPNTVTSVGAGGGSAVMAAQNAWECYWVDAIKRGDTAAEQRAHAELNSLLAHNIFEAPAGAPENYTPPNPPNTPYAVFAHDGGLAWVRKAYADAAAGRPQNLIDSCNANRPS